MKSMAKWMLGAAVIAGGLGLGTTAAQAAEWRVVVGAPEAYVPPCPGPGYAWAAGYYDGGYWVPGRWNFVGVSYHEDYRAARYYDRDDHRSFRESDEHRGWDHDRGGWDRHDGRGWDRDHHDNDRHDRDNRRDGDREHFRR